MKFKRIIAAAMAVAIVFGTFSAVPAKTAKNLGAVSASAATFTTEGTSGDYKYGIKEDGYMGNSLYITGYTGSEEVLKIPDTLDIDGTATPVKGIATGAFANNDTIKSLTITPGIRDIEGGAFENCTALTSLAFKPADDKAELSIGEMAFSGCTALSSVTFEAELKGSVGYYWIGNFAFLNCPALKEVTMPSYVGLSGFVPIFGYSQADKSDYPSFVKDEDGNVTTNLVKNDEFMMNCYMHSNAAQNAEYCGLAYDYIDGPYTLEDVNAQVLQTKRNNPNYDIVFADTGFGASRVNNLDGYADCITEYFMSLDSLVAGYANITAHRIIDIDNKEPLLEYGTTNTSKDYDATIDHGIVSVNCFGQGIILDEYSYIMDLLPKDGYIIPDEKMDAVRGDSMEYTKIVPRYCDINGTDKFTHDYGAGNPMINGYAFVGANNEDSSAAIIDRTGKVVLKLPQSFGRASVPARTNGSALNMVTSYSMCSEIEAGYQQGLMPFYSQYKHDGETIFDADCEKEGFEGWYTDMLTDKKFCGYMDLKGNIVIPQQYTDAGGFTEDGLAWVISSEQAEKYNYSGASNMAVYPVLGFIDTKGKTVIPFEYSYATDFDGGYAAVKKGTKFGMIDTENNTVVPFEYEDTKGSKEGFMTAKKNGKWGMVDKYGNTVIPFVFEDVSLYADGKAFAVSLGEVYRFDISKGGASYLFGDVNGDGAVDIEDAVKVISHINGITPLTDEEEIRADATFNSDIDIEDAVCIINQVNGVSVITPPESMKQ